MRKANLTSKYDPIEKLMTEHEEGLKQLYVMQNASTLLEEQGFSEEIYLDVVISLKFINTEIRQHNEIEETALFPILEKHVPDGPVAVMLEEHRLLWERLESLAKILPLLRNNPTDEETVDQVIQDACFIVQLLTDHIAKENEILYPLAKDYLSPSEWTAVANKMGLV